MRTIIKTLMIFFCFCAAAQATELKAPGGCRLAQDAKAGPEGWADRVIHEKTGLELILIPAGSFMMGTEDRSRGTYVGPVHKVTIGQPFYMGKTEVTNGQYRRFTQAQPDYKGEADCDPAYDLYLLHFKGKSVMSAEDNYPVVWVSWHNATAFCRWAGLQLPSEAQWEYACRAGTTTHYSFGDSEGELHKYAWADLAAGHRTHPVATKLPNPWGLYDMHGNVWEWTLDDYRSRYDDQEEGTGRLSGYDHAPTDGSARRVPDAMTKVLRGGSWSNGPGVVRKTPVWWYSSAMGSAARFRVAPGNAWHDRGFRVVLPMKNLKLSH